MRNSNLNAAKAAKNDEFYTMYEDVAKELKYYEKHFDGKVVYCNCDDWEHSNFVKYLADNFDRLKLKKLIATCYVNEGKGKKYVNDGKRIETSYLCGDGDFRSAESVALLQECDVVVTNPPFSLFREYIAQLTEHGKQFLIIGNQNAITYNEVFPLIKANKLWLGVSIYNGDREFRIPSHYEVISKSFRTDEHGNRYVKVNGVRWFTNMRYEAQKPTVTLTARYDPDRYPKYDNLQEAVNCDKVVDIPCDYYGVIGVPITFLDKHNPNADTNGDTVTTNDFEFAILGGGKFDTQASEWNKQICEVADTEEKVTLNDFIIVGNKQRPTIDKKPIYKRLLIQRI